MIKKIVITLIILLILIPLVIVFLLFPGASFRELSSAPSAVPAEIKAGMKTINIPESWIRNRALLLLEENRQQLQPAVLQGMDINCGRGGVVLVLGVSLPTPVIGEFPLMVKARLPISFDGDLVIGLEDLKIGRLPIPGFVQQAVLNKVDRKMGPAELPLEAPYSLDMEKPELRLSIDLLLDSILPGVRPAAVKTVPSSINVLVSFPAALEKRAEELLAALLNERSALETLIAEGLPEDRRDMQVLADDILLTAQDVMSEQEEVRGAVVAWCDGDVEIKPAGAPDFHWAEFGESVSVGSTVRTGRGSSAELVLPGSCVLRLDESTSMVLEHSYGTDELHQNTVQHLTGALRNKVAVLSGDDSWYLLHSGGTVLGVRGTDFCSFLERGGDIRVAVFDGSVTVAAGDKESLVVKVDEALDVTKTGYEGPRPISDEEKSKTSSGLRIETTDDVINSLSEKSPITILMPLVFEYTDLVTVLSEVEILTLRNALKSFFKAAPDVARAADEFFRTAGLEQVRLELQNLLR